MSQTQTRHKLFEVDNVIRHKRRKHVRRKIISFQEGLPWTFRIRPDGRFYPEAKSLLLTRIEEWELDYGETQEEGGETTPCQDDHPSRLD